MAHGETAGQWARLVLMQFPRASLVQSLLVLAAAAALPACLVTLAGTTRPVQAGVQDGDPYTEVIRPLLDRYCSECHGVDKRKGGIRFDQVDPDMLNGRDAEIWAEALDLLDYGDMPPEDSERPLSLRERKALMTWMRTELDAAAEVKSSERRTVMRRLNREQYTRSLQDLLELSIDFGQRLPADGKSPMGFSNNGEVLRASALHLEYYQSIARDALNQAIAIGDRPTPTRYLVSLGTGVGMGRPGARTGGYQSVPLSPNDFRVDLIDAEGRERIGSDGLSPQQIERIQRRVTVGLRGSSQDRFHTVPEGVILYGALPHKEVAPGAWQGPSPNMKLEMQRVFPQEGDFVLRVRASRGYLVAERKELLVGLDDPHPLASWTPRVRGAAPSEAEQLAMQPTELGPWYIAGPIPAKTGAEARNTVYIGAPQIDFDAPLDDGKTQWRLAGDIDGKIQRYASERGVVILARTIHAASPRTMEISIGSDDACWIWLNGEKVLAADVQRGVAADQNFVSLNLKEGRNDLLIKVVNDQGGFGSYHRLIHDGTVRSSAPYRVDATPGAHVLLAERATGVKNLRFENGSYIAEDFPADSTAQLQLDLPAGYWQFDLVHPALAPDAMGSVRLAIDGRRLDLRPISTAEEVAQGTVVTPLGAGFLNSGRRTITLGGPFFVGFSHLVLTPLPADHPLVQRLEAQSVAEQPTELPALRAFIGTRTDDGMDYASFDTPRTVTGALGESQLYEFHGRLENLPIPEPESGDDAELSGICVLGVWNDHLVKSRDQPGPPLLIESMEFEAPYYPVWPPASHTAIFHDSPNRGDEEVYTREILGHFLPRAFRRAVGADELERYLAYWRAGRADYSIYEYSVREALVAALCSPSFLFLAEPVDTVDDEGRISEDMLATRLAYFLWNAPPDAELAALAREGRLRAELDAQTERMLDDPRSVGFVRSFTREWLRLDRLEGITINPNQFPAFTRFVKRDLAEETYGFLAHVLNENLPLSTLIDSDFAMLNQNLAEFYGIDGVEGIEFRPVPITTEAGRGGLLAQASFLAGHSDGNEPHPIKRAVWVKEKLLGQEAMPPPPNVPDLDPTTPGFDNLTLKEKLIAHRDNPSCHDCHAAFDPYGIALERYNAVGLLQDERKGRPVDPATVLPDGTPVAGADGLRQYLLEQVPDQFADSVIKHIFAYALGRDTDFADRAELEEIAAQVSAEGSTLRGVVREIVQSPSFRDR